MSLTMQEGMALSEAALTKDEKGVLTDTIIQLALDKLSFTVDEVWEISGVREHRGIGGILSRCKRAGICTQDGYVQKERGQDKGRWQITKWRSLVHPDAEVRKPCPHCNGTGEVTV